MEKRLERDSMGEIQVDIDRYWGAQTQRSFENFKIGRGAEIMPYQVIKALALLKKAAAYSNAKLLPKKMTEEKLSAIENACDQILDGSLIEHFPLVVFQTGSGTQTNMNVNEVIANRANALLNKPLVHPNDDVNMSQSSNDAFPTAMCISAVLEVEDKLLPALTDLIDSFEKLEKENEGVITCGRTHLQDATPISFSQEVSGWKDSLKRDVESIKTSLIPLYSVAIGGTAVGTGLNAPKDFDKLTAKTLAQLTNKPFTAAENKFTELSSKSDFAFAHGGLKALATDLMKIANDIRWLASGPRNGLGEITLPANEPGSSIMPGKVNPTQCEAVTMVASQVMGNDATVSFSASMGNFQLNVFMPVIIYNFLQSARLLTDCVNSFNEKCVKGIKVNRDKMNDNLNRSLMLVTALSPIIGYEKCAIVAKKAYNENLSLRQACIALGYLTEEEFDENFHPEQMV